MTLFLKWLSHLSSDLQHTPKNMGVWSHMLPQQEGGRNGEVACQSCQISVLQVHKEAICQKLSGRSYRKASNVNLWAPFMHIHIQEHTCKSTDICMSYTKNNELYTLWCLNHMPVILVKCLEHQQNPNIYTLIRPTPISHPLSMELGNSKYSIQVFILQN